MNIASAPSIRRTVTIRKTIAGFALGVGIVALGACNAEQRRGLGEIDARDELHDRVEQAVSDRGQSIRGDLDCDVDIDRAGNLTASCAGVTDDGDEVFGSFDGTADVEAEECEAALTITVADEVAVTSPQVACFN